MATIAIRKIASATILAVILYLHIKNPVLIVYVSGILSHLFENKSVFGYLFSVRLRRAKIIGFKTIYKRWAEQPRRRRLDSAQKTK
jgi:hypothetical protein